MGYALREPKMDEQWLPEIAITDGDPDPRRLGAGRGLRHLIKEAEAESRRTQKAPSKCFTKIWRGVLGLRDHLDRNTHRGYRTTFEPDKATVHYTDLPIREVSEELFGGSDFVDGLVNDKLEGANVAKLREATSGAIRESFAPATSSVYQDINYWSIYVGGLAEAAFLEKYQSPRFIAKEMVQSKPTNMRQQRIFTTAAVPGASDAIDEGVEYSDALPLPRWIVRPPVIKRGQRASVTKETIAYGIGGSLLESLGGGGNTLAYIQEYLLAAYLQGVNIPVGQQWFRKGVTVNTYIYNQEPGSSYQSTYQTSAGSGATAMYNYVNKTTGSSGLQTYLQLQAARLLLSLMTEYETGFRIEADLKMIKVAKGAVDNAYNVLHATSIAPVNPGFATTGTPVMTFSGNPPGNANLQVLASAIWDQVLSDAGISASNILDYWYGGDFREAFGWASLWDTVLNMVDVRSADLVSRDIVWAATYGWCGTPYVREPRHVLQYTN